jgi:hypothetical protein
MLQVQKEMLSLLRAFFLSNPWVIIDVK